MESYDCRRQADPPAGGSLQQSYISVVGLAPEGSGLGLALVQGWVDTMGGSVDLDTTPGAGTVVTVRLPR